MTPEEVRTDARLRQGFTLPTSRPMHTEVVWYPGELHPCPGFHSSGDRGCADIHDPPPAPSLEGVGVSVRRGGGCQDSLCVSLSLQFVLKRNKKNTNNTNTDRQWVRDQIKILSMQEKEHREGTLLAGQRNDHGDDLS